MVTQTTSEKQTIELGKKIGECLVGGEVLLLEGALGAGKTTLVKGIAKGLNIKTSVRSPTFLVMRVYPGRNRLKLVHADGYRLQSPEDCFSVGLQDFLGRGDSVVVIEWPARLTPLIEKLKVKNEKLIPIKLESINETTRRITY